MLRGLLCFDGDDVAQVGGIERTFMVRFIDLSIGSELRAEDDGTLAMPVVNMVQNPLQAAVFFAVFGVKKIRNNGRIGDDFQQHNTGFFVERSGAICATECRKGIVDQFGRIGRGYGKRDNLVEIMLSYIRAKGGSVGINEQLLAGRMLQS